jgi:hypothetical protein
VPFYASTSGTSGKQAGKWYPFLGIDPEVFWLVKPSLEELESGFGIQEIQELQNLLNTQLQAIPLYTISDELLKIEPMLEGDPIDTFLKHKLFPELNLRPKTGEKVDAVAYTKQAIALLAKDIGVTRKETEQQQELKVGDTISLLNKTKTSSHTWIIESISQEGDTTRVYLKSKDGAHSLRLPLEEVLGGIEATNEWRANPDNKKESFSNPPVGELIKIFNENRKDRRALYELYVAWDNKYIASGLIDQMREKNGNIAVSAEQIESTKKLLQAYKKILELDANESYIPGIPSVSLRFFNIFGPRQNGNGPYANVISSWLHRLKNKQSIRLDSSFVVFDEAGRETQPGERVAEPNTPEFFGDFSQKFESHFDRKLARDVRLTSRFSGEFLFHVEGGFDILLDSHQPVDDIITTLQAALDRGIPEADRAQLSRVDLRTPNKVYYTVKGDADER